jgi:hypothetical protein
MDKEEKYTMGTDKDIIELHHIMQKEVELLKDFARIEEKLEAQIQKKQWEKVDGIMNQLKAHSVEIEQVEEKRHSSYQSLKQKYGVKNGEGFKAFLKQFMEAGKSGDIKKLEKLHRELRESAYKVKIISSSFSYYYQYMLNVISQFLGEIFPHQKGKIYSKEGKSTQSSPEPLMVNQKL